MSKTIAQLKEQQKEGIQFAITGMIFYWINIFYFVLLVGDYSISTITFTILYAFFDFYVGGVIYSIYFDHSDSFNLRIKLEIESIKEKNKSIKKMTKIKTKETV